MSKKIGFIGCGHMGKAMVGALVNSVDIDKKDIIVSTKTQESINRIKEEFNIRTTLHNREVVMESDIIFLAITPNYYESVIDEIKDYVLQHQIIVLIAAGIELQQVGNWFGKPIKVVKTMPNTPVLVNEGMSAICHNAHVDKEDLQYICNLYSLFGKYEILNEEDFHAFIALCGSSPAYIFILIEAMADAAVKLGLPREKAYRMAEQSILGSAKLALETGKHPAELKDMVCSPGGATIAAVTQLEKMGFRNAVISSMEACADQSKKMQDENK